MAVDTIVEDEGLIPLVFSAMNMDGSWIYQRTDTNEDVNSKCVRKIVKANYESVEYDERGKVTGINLPVGGINGLILDEKMYCFVDLDCAEEERKTGMAPSN